MREKFLLPLGLGVKSYTSLHRLSHGDSFAKHHNESVRKNMKLAMYLCGDELRGEWQIRKGKAAERHVLGGFDDGLCLAVEESGDVAEVASSVSVW